MHFIPSQPSSWFNLPRGGGVAYAAQESWVQSTTIRENILFGASYDEERYKEGNKNDFFLERKLILLSGSPMCFGTRP